MKSIDGIRKRINQLNYQLIHRMAERSQYPVNDSIYEPGRFPMKIPTVEGRNTAELSLMLFSVIRLERNHTDMGRFEYGDQRPMFINVTESQVNRNAPKPIAKDAKINITDEIVGFYRDGIVGQLCAEGEDSDTFGETADLDSQLLMLLHERTNAIGQNVAQIKINDSPELFNQENEPHPLNDPERVKRVITMVTEQAAREGLSKRNITIVSDIFKWIIKKTEDVEETYRQKLLNEKKKVIKT